GATCTLRQAIATASPGDTINFAAGLTTVNLTSSELVIDKNLTITGPGANLLTIQRSFFGIIPNFRVFDVGANTNVTISGLTIAGGNVPGNSGGGIFNSGTLTIASCAISANSANNGGGIRSDPNSILTITNSTLSNNSAGAGGGISLFGPNVVAFTNSTLSGNSATNG